MGYLTLTLGDIHGEDKWKALGDVETLILSGGSGTPKFDKYIFVGDYVDSYYKTDEQIIDNLNDVISFKEMYPSHVVLLLGNHDVQYLHDKNWPYRASGYRGNMLEALKAIFTTNLSKFDVAYGLGNTIWTHAGVHATWYRRAALPDYQGDGVKLAAKLNDMFDNDVSELYDIGVIKGGLENVGGPLWVDKSKLYKHPLTGYDQIVGHTAALKIETYNIDGNLLTFVDVLSSWKFYVPTISEKLAKGLVRYINT